MGELSLINITWGQEVSGGPKPWTQLSHLRGSGQTPGWSIKTGSAAQHGRKEKRTDRAPKQMVKAKVNTQNHTKKHTHTHSQKGKNNNNKTNEQTEPQDKR